MENQKKNMILLKLVQIVILFQQYLTIDIPIQFFQKIQFELMKSYVIQKIH